MYTPINGWTKERIIKQIQTKMLDHRSYNDRMESAGACLYLASDGNRCAVGVFIPEGHDAEKYEGGVYALMSKHADLNDLMPLECKALMQLQCIHDNGKVELLSRSVKLYDVETGDPRPALIKWVEENVEAS